MMAAEALAAMRALPERPLGVLLEGGAPLILAPHPDDESIGTGGLIAAACAAGAPPFVLILTDGAGSHPGVAKGGLRARRRAEALAATAILGLAAERVGFLNLPDTASPTAGPAFEAAVTAVAALALRTGAGSLLATWAHDPHCDHESAHLIARAAAAQAGVPHRAYPVWGWTLPPAARLRGGPPRGMRLDISAQLDRKRRAIAAHRSQLGELAGGFVLPPDLLAIAGQTFEVYLDVEP